MATGEYVVYERASKDGEQLFLDIAREAIMEVQEPPGWKKHRDPKKHAAGGKPISYHFKPMLMVLLLMNYHRKDYREMAAHLKCNMYLLNEIGLLDKAPGKSTIHAAHGKMNTRLLRNINDVILLQFKKAVAEEQRNMYLQIRQDSG